MVCLDSSPLSAVQRLPDACPVQVQLAVKPAKVTEILAYSSQWSSPVLLWPLQLLLL